MVNGVAQATGVAIDVTAAQLGQTTFQSGSGTDDLWVRASDGISWSAWNEFHVVAPVDPRYRPLDMSLCAQIVVGARRPHPLCDQPIDHLSPSTFDR